MAPASMLAAFQSKQIDGYAMSLPWPQKAVQDGEALLIASGPDGEPGDMIPFGHNMIVTQQDTCEKRKALCMAMGQSIKDAAAFIKTKPDEAFALLKKRFPTLDDKLLRASFEELQKVTPSPPHRQQGHHRELGELQRRRRPAQGRREAQVLRRPVHQRVRAMTMRPALLAAILALAAAPLAAQPAALQDIIIAMPNFTFTSTPNFIAEELGLWAKHGLRVKIIQIAGVGATNAVIAGSADFVQAGGSTLTRAAARGQRLLAIANTAERNIVAITMRKEIAEAAGFDAKAPLEKRAAVLRGKTFGVGAINANPHAYLLAVAAQRRRQAGRAARHRARRQRHDGGVPEQADRRHVELAALAAEAGGRRPLGGDRQRAGGRPAERHQLRL